MADAYVQPFWTYDLCQCCVGSCSFCCYGWFCSGCLAADLRIAPDEPDLCCCANSFGGKWWEIFLLSLLLWTSQAAPMLSIILYITFCIFVRKSVMAVAKQAGVDYGSKCTWCHFFTWMFCMPCHLIQ